MGKEAAMKIAEITTNRIAVPLKNLLKQRFEPSAPQKPSLSK